ncbi:UDP-N-acetylmuramate dehydrogenase [Hydrogenimonas urashimensis]|uniref:UDP-N-acetylmuramate dehydrogenase n=1 Tax=Hydrogenimonas urashimensis TaxID=2740515 RepID=UPI001915688D|nr:UDP-N-acetylmuramate dehydrogenase [Hydrogenimonas urashimensis]
MTFRRIDFSKFSSIKIGPAIDVMVLEKGDSPPSGRFLIGHANNLLISCAPPPLMMLGKDFDYIAIEEDALVIGASTPTGKILSFCKKHDIGGFEYVAKLPGTLGGMLAMNAGVKSHETFDALLGVVTDRGRFRKEEIPHGYRYAQLPGIAYEASFMLKRGFDRHLAEALVALRAHQPREPSAGSVFKNPPGDYAGRLIEEAGLKGHRIGAMAWSRMHANFLVNLGGGSFEDAMALIDLARRRVWKQFGVELSLEIKIVDK